MLFKGKGAFYFPLKSGKYEGRKKKRHLLKDFGCLKIGDPKIAETGGSLALSQSTLASSVKKMGTGLVHAHVRQHMNV